MAETRLRSLLREVRRHLAHERLPHPSPEMRTPLRPEELALRCHYVSTYCIHGLHAECRLSCKTCAERCRCSCGHPSEGEDDDE